MNTRRTLFSFLGLAAAAPAVEGLSRYAGEKGLGLPTLPYNPPPRALTPDEQLYSQLREVGHKMLSDANTFDVNYETQHFRLDQMKSMSQAARRHYVNRQRDEHRSLRNSIWAKLGLTAMEEKLWGSTAKSGGSALDRQSNQTQRDRPH